MFSFDDSLLDRLGLGSLNGEQRDAVRQAAQELVSTRASMMVMRIMSRRQVVELAESRQTGTGNAWILANMPEFSDIQMVEFENVIGLMTTVVSQVEASRSGANDAE